MGGATPILASFFRIEAGDYENFTVSAATADMIRNLILAFAVGIILASAYAFYQKYVVGHVVRAVLSARANTPETAKTAAELGLDRNFFYRYELGHNAALKRLICRVAGNAPLPTGEAVADALMTELTETVTGDADGGEESITADERYYIPEEKKYSAEARFEKKGNGPVALIVTAVIALLAAFLLIRFVPNILAIADNLMG